MATVIVKRNRKRHVQLTLDRARKPTGYGGWRPGAGRPKGRTTVPHDTRPAFAARYPLHATWRLVDGVASLRRDHIAKTIRDAIRQTQGDAFQVAEFSIQSNHLHLVVEAKGPAALAVGMQLLGVRLARRLNRRLARTGKLFATRYHSRALRTPREVRNVLRYVLLNARHHATHAIARRWIDPYSSAPWFGGWALRIDTTVTWVRRLVDEAPPTRPPKTWLLGEGWRRHGPIAFDDTPGEIHARAERPDRRTPSRS